MKNRMIVFITLILSVLLLFSSCGQTGYKIDTLSATDMITGETVNIKIEPVKADVVDYTGFTGFYSNKSLEKIAKSLDGLTTEEKGKVELFSLGEKQAVFLVETYEGRKIYFALTNIGKKQFVFHDCVARIDDIIVAFPYYVLNDEEEVFTSFDNIENRKFETVYFCEDLLRYYQTLGVYATTSVEDNAFELVAVTSENKDIKAAVPIRVAFFTEDKGTRYFTIEKID